MTNNSSRDPITNTPDGLVQDLFLARAAQSPERVAVISATRSISYGDLLSESQAWARRLRKSGAKPNTLVAVVMEKGWEQITGVLGILQAGAAYLPIDPKFPKERLWYLLENSGAEIVLTQSWLDSKLDWPDGVKRFCVDREPIESVEPSSNDARAGTNSPASADDLAYVLYTSGSTGKPKGVMIRHRGIVNCVVETNRTFNVTENDRAIAVTALHHDMSVYDIFGMLGAGGTIVIPTPAGARAPDHWVELIERHGVTIWNSVPGFMEMLLEYAAGQRLEVPNRLRLAFLGGDWIPLSTPERIRKHFGDTQVVSVGGPTETTVWNIWYPVKKVDSSWRSIPYGHAIANTRYLVLDEALEECAPGTAGELCCAGVGLMQGYWRDEEQTRAKLVMRPQSGELIYRTGDRGRLLADGEIEFLGRIDSQVKVNGQRIELGEIEAALLSFPGVRQAAVKVTESGGHKRLAAYLVSESAVLDASALRTFLESSLPQSMIPSSFVALKSLPLNGNGKVDRSALPAAVETAEKLEPNRTTRPGGQDQNADVEATIAGVFRHALSLPEVGLDDNFFDLGADSLLMVHAHTALQTALAQAGSRRSLSITQLFEFPSVRSLAKYLQGQTSGTVALSDIQKRAERQRQSAVAARSRLVTK
jgi:pyochelin synthetase